MERRRRNIVIFKVPEHESNGIHLKSKVKALILDKCKVDIGNHIDKIYRIGKPEPTKIRPILLGLTSLDKKMEIFWGKKHHNADLEIADDFAPEVLSARKSLVPVLKKLRELGYQNVHLKQDKLFVDGTAVEESHWKEMIKESSAKTDLIKDLTQETNTKRKADKISPNANATKRSSTAKPTPIKLSQKELYPQKPETIKDYLIAPRPPPSPLTNFLAKRAVADADAYKKGESNLNQTIK